MPHVWKHKHGIWNKITVHHSSLEESCDSEGKLQSSRQDSCQAKVASLCRRPPAPQSRAPVVTDTESKETRPTKFAQVGIFLYIKCISAKTMFQMQTWPFWHMFPHVPTILTLCAAMCTILDHFAACQAMLARSAHVNPILGLSWSMLGQNGTYL